MNPKINLYFHGHNTQKIIIGISKLNNPAIIQILLYFMNKSTKKMYIQINI